MTGLPFVLWTGGGQHQCPLAPSLDRIDTSNPDYSPENTRVVCWAVNAGMGSFGLDVYLAIAASALGVSNSSTDAIIAGLQEIPNDE